MGPTISTAIANFLRAKMRDHAGPDLISRYLAYPGLETQVLTDKSRAEQVRRGVWIRNSYLDEFWDIRIPKCAATDPHFRDYRLPWPLDLHALAIGSTGWDWQHRCSRWVGFDFDSIVGHAENALTDGELTSVREAACALDYVEVRASTSGRGLHLYVPFADGGIPNVPNHTAHTRVAWSVLRKMSQDACFDFRGGLDCCGSVLWIWHKRAAKDGFHLIKGVI